VFAYEKCLMSYKTAEIMVVPISNSASVATTGYCYKYSVFQYLFHCFAREGVIVYIYIYILQSGLYRILSVRLFARFISKTNERILMKCLSMKVSILKYDFIISRIS
jgi:hypothetical protein